MGRRRWWLRLATGAGVVVLLLGAAVTQVWPALAVALSLAGPGAGAWLDRLAPPVTEQEITLPTAGRFLVADLYRPARPRGALLLVHGLSRAGRRQPDLAHLARTLARAGQLVLVPQLDGLAAFRLGGREVADIRAWLADLGARGLPVGIAGFSFGAGPALLAAAEVPGLRVIGSFGGYADLRLVIAFVTTGVHVHDGRRHVQQQEEYNRWKLLALLAGFLDDPDERPRLEALAERKLADPGAAAVELEAALGAPGRAMVDLVTNRREDAVETLIEALPAAAREALARLSPLRVLPRLRGRLLIAHGAGDASIPYTESLRLAAAAGQPVHLVIFRSFDHTAPRSGLSSARARALDAWDLLGLARALLAG